MSSWDFNGECMDRKEEYEEKRKHRRFPVCDGAFAVIIPKPCLIGQILDICMGGLCLQYLPNGSHPLSAHLDIFLSNQRFYIKGIPFKIISDRLCESQFSFSLLSVYRCGVQFLHLTDSQIIALIRFIKTCTRL